MLFPCSREYRWQTTKQTRQSATATYLSFPHVASRASFSGDALPSGNEAILQRPRDNDHDLQAKYSQAAQPLRLTHLTIVHAYSTNAQLVRNTTATDMCPST